MIFNQHHMSWNTCPVASLCLTAPKRDGCNPVCMHAGSSRAGLGWLIHASLGCAWPAWEGRCPLTFACCNNWLQWWSAVL